MKLSELSTDQALDALCELTPYIANIASDEDLVNTLGKGMDVKDGMNLYGQFTLLAGRVGEIAPLLLKAHRNDVYGVLSVLNETSVAEIASQPITDTIRQVREVFQDSDLMRFFKSSAQQGQTEPSVPSADSPASE